MSVEEQFLSVEVYNRSYCVWVTLGGCAKIIVKFAIHMTVLV